jgi:hypothetical protein
MTALKREEDARREWTCPVRTFVVNEEGVLHNGEHPWISNAPCIGNDCPVWRDAPGSAPVDIPWAEHACAPEHLVRRIEAATDIKNISKSGGVKPHGRVAWTLIFQKFGDPRLVDLSIYPRKETMAALSETSPASETEAAR